MWQEFFKFDISDSISGKRFVDIVNWLAKFKVFALKLEDVA